VLDTRYAVTYLPMAQRAMVKAGNVTIHTTDGEYEASELLRMPASRRPLGRAGFCL
jgi:hypothetical protein